MYYIRSKRIVTPTAVVDGFVCYSKGKIVDILPASNYITTYLDYTNDVVLPGLIDFHVHINEPGRTDWEGFETATKAAAVGGITTLIEMPLNANPPTTTEENFKVKLIAANNKLWVNVGFWGGVVPQNYFQIDDLLSAGVFGLKAFLTPSGIDEFEKVSEKDLLQALRILKYHNKPLLVHCELDKKHKDEAQLKKDFRNYNAYMKSRPHSWEVNAVKVMINLCRETGVAVHLVHISSAECLPLIKAAKKEGLRLTAETCPHYLLFNAEEIPHGATLFKCAPPIREKENNLKLIEALKNGVLDCVVTDHSPAPPEMKDLDRGNFIKAWGGIAGLQFLLPVFNTIAQQNDIGLVKLAQLLSGFASDFLQLPHKGKIIPGNDADFVIYNPETPITITADKIQHRYTTTPYLGRTLNGEVLLTMLKGNVVYAKELPLRKNAIGEKLFN